MCHCSALRHQVKRRRARRAATTRKSEPSRDAPRTPQRRIVLPDKTPSTQCPQEGRKQPSEHAPAQSFRETKLPKDADGKKRIRKNLAAFAARTLPLRTSSQAPTLASASAPARPHRALSARRPCRKTRLFWPRNRVLARIPALLGSQEVLRSTKPQVGKFEGKQNAAKSPERVPERGFVAKIRGFSRTRIACGRVSLAGEAVCEREESRARAERRPCTNEERAARDRRLCGALGGWRDAGSIRTERGWMRARRAGPVSGRRRRTVCEHGLRAGRSQVARRGLASSCGLASSWSRGARERKAHANGA